MCADSWAEMSALNGAGSLSKLPDSSGVLLRLLWARVHLLAEQLWQTGIMLRGQLPMLCWQSAYLSYTYLQITALRCSTGIILR